MIDRPHPAPHWEPGRLACQAIPGGFALVDLDWPGDGEICRVMHDGIRNNPIDTKDRFFFVAQFVDLWNKVNRDKLGGPQP